MASAVKVFHAAVLVSVVVLVSLLVLVLSGPVPYSKVTEDVLLSYTLAVFTITAPTPTPTPTVLAATRPVRSVCRLIYAGVFSVVCWPSCPPFSSVSLTDCGQRAAFDGHKVIGDIRIMRHADGNGNHARRYANHVGLASYVIGGFHGQIPVGGSQHALFHRHAGLAFGRKARIADTDGKGACASLLPGTNF